MRRPIPSLLRATALALLASAFLAAPGGAQERRGTPGEFDYYVFAMSWSPAHCARAGRDADPAQCGPNADFGFIVHGLWPQDERRGWPAFCIREPEPVPEWAVREMMLIMPSQRLIEHQWRKHGTCSGLGLSDYFADTMAMWERVYVPHQLWKPEPGLELPAEEVERLFLEANPDMTAEGIAVQCDRRGVYEVRICVDKELNKRPCGERVVDRCRAGDELVKR